MLDSPLLHGLGSAERTAIEARLRPRRYRRGDTVFSDGDPGDGLHLVRSGRFDVQFTTQAGNTISLRVVQPGEIFGELALVHPGGRRTGRVVALEPAETCVLHPSDFDDVRRRYPTVDRFLVSVLAEQLVRTSEIAVEMLLPPEARVWRRLARLADAYCGESIAMSQEDLARSAGTVRQTVNRVLRAGVAEGSLRVGRGTIRVLDRRLLALRAGV